MNRITGHAGNRSRRSLQGGFTLVEVIVVLSVVLLLTGIAVPMLSSYMEDGRRARAEAEAQVIGAAVSCHATRTSALYPARNSSATTSTISTCSTRAGADLQPVDGRPQPGSTWALGAHAATSIDNHLLLNQPQGRTAAAYPVTGNLRWRGPYVAGTTPLDPWGRPTSSTSSVRLPHRRRPTTSGSG